ncbi:hypothetical protein [Phyllobacterium endophyticum]|uniref:hypothetical protein n=1 Tax=Phyllobacterium endophyticum TaxID=1149773 RepID=UPI0011CBF8D6|nr:hypothetical protein [Phyllobacterium endophyticum]TXR50447.1 hypothetical protein FVA77_03925 [Phyllobacterium endophyticum]
MDPQYKCALAVKPVLWSQNGYTGPCGPKVIGGFVAKHGYGGEEWNNVPTRIWKGRRIFHTETSEKINQYARYGNLALIMIAMHNDVQHIVGVACGVTYNEDWESTGIAQELELATVAKDVWAIESVRRRHTSYNNFLSLWGTGRHTIRWQCPDHLYHWFAEPFALPKYPLRPDKMVLAKMHGGYQAVRPEDGLKLLGEALPSNHPIREWLIDQDFDDAFLSSVDRKHKPALTPKERRYNYSSAAAIDPYLRYIQERILTINPAHGQLEQRFHCHLNDIGATSIKKNHHGIDALFTHPQKGLCLAELKPTLEHETRFAIRLALGQVLEYRNFIEPLAQPLIVTSSRPRDEEIDFLRNLGIACGWAIDTRFEFRWP